MFSNSNLQIKKIYVIPWKDWKYLKEIVNKKSVNEKDLKEYQVLLKNGLLNFLKI